jgi:hypothetical protein
VEGARAGGRVDEEDMDGGFGLLEGGEDTSMLSGTAEDIDARGRAAAELDEVRAGSPVRECETSSFCLYAEKRTRAVMKTGDSEEVEVNRTV